MNHSRDNIFEPNYLLFEFTLIRRVSKDERGDGHLVDSNQQLIRYF